MGGKAYNLSQIARKGFPVPEGFCITTKAYDYFMNFLNISGEDRNKEYRIRNGSMPPLLAEVIYNAYHRYLNSTLCAVRSSSPFEDLKSASFAGQYESFLSVGEDTLLHAIKGCWASLWSQKAVEYRKNKGIENENCRMAILLLEMIPAQAAGVLFTEDDMTIEGIWGLGIYWWEEG